MELSVVIPCYNSSETIKKVVALVTEELKQCSRTAFEFILVNDASPDQGATMQALKELAEEYDNVTAVELAKNAGQHNAVIAGLNCAAGEAILCMDDDMQTHPSQIHKLLEEFDRGHDIVYGYYPEKKHNVFRNLGSHFNYLSVRILIGKPKELKTSSFWVIQKFVRDEVVKYKNSYTYLQGLFLRTTQNISCIPVEHFEREIGTSNYTLKKLIRLWSSILGFSLVPLRLAIYAGYLFSGLGILGAVVVLVQKLLSPAMAVGWPSMMVAICFFSGINLLFLGLVGEYIGRMFLGMNREPQYVVRKIYRKKGDQEQ